MVRKEAMPPSKKLKKPGKKVAQRKYNADKEKFDKKMSVKDNSWKKTPSGIAEAMDKASEGYSKKPRVKPSKKKGPGY